MDNFDQLKAAEADLAVAFSRYLAAISQALSMPRAEMGRRIGVSRGAFEGLFAGRHLPSGAQWWAVRRVFAATRSNGRRLADAAGGALRVGASRVEMAADGQRTDLRISEVFSLAQLQALVSELLANDVEVREPFAIIQETARGGALVDVACDLPTAAALRILRLKRPESD